MLTRTSRIAPLAEADEDLQRLRGVLVAAFVAAVMVLTGLGYSLWSAFGPHDQSGSDDVPSPPSATSPQGGTSSLSEQVAAIAAAPMPSLPPEAAQPGPLAPAAPAPILIPAPTGRDAVGVATGYPHTPAGALGQLAAIDEAAFSRPALAHTRAVVAAWTTPGGPSEASWSGTRAMATLLSSAGMSTDASGQMTITYRVLAGQIKGVVGLDDAPAAAVVCVNGELQLSLRQTRRVGVSDCQVMTWDGVRWRLGPGPEPASAADVWPGTPAAYDAGWKDLRHDTP